MGASERCSCKESSLERMRIQAQEREICLVGEGGSTMIKYLPTYVPMLWREGMESKCIIVLMDAER